MKILHDQSVDWEKLDQVLTTSKLGWGNRVILRFRRSKTFDELGGLAAQKHTTIFTDGNHLVMDSSIAVVLEVNGKYVLEKVQGGESEWDCDALRYTISPSKRGQTVHDFLYNRSKDIGKVLAVVHLVDVTFNNTICGYEEKKESSLYVYTFLKKRDVLDN